MARRTKTWTIEMFWDCPHCRKRNPGMTGAERESLRCVTCGYEKQESDKWVMPSDAATAAPHLSGDLDRKARAGENWFCGYCEKESRITSSTCETCGAKRHPYAAVPEEFPKEPVPKDHGKDVNTRPWRCQPCGWENEYNVAYCSECGSPKGARWNGKPAITEADRKKQVGEAIDSIMEQLSSKGETVASHPADPPRVQPGPEPRKVVPNPSPTVSYRQPAFVPLPDEPESKLPKLKDKWPFVAGPLGLGLFIWFAVWLFSPNETNARVADMHWHRAETLQERHDYSGEGWQDQEPADVFQETCESRQRGTERCHPHDCNCHDVPYDCRCTGGDSYRCNCHEVCSRSCSPNRNGSATCTESCDDECDTCTTPRRCDTCTRTECDTCYDQCPVMVNWCHYQYHQWDTLGHHELDRHDFTPMWPEPPYAASHALQRVLREESYHVIFRDDEDQTRTWDESFDENHFHDFRPRQHWHVRYTHAGSFNLLNQVP